MASAGLRLRDDSQLTHQDGADEDADCEREQVGRRPPLGSETVDQDIEPHMPALALQPGGGEKGDEQQAPLVERDDPADRDAEEIAHHHVARDADYLKQQQRAGDPCHGADHAIEQSSHRRSRVRVVVTAARRATVARRAATDTTIA